MEATQLTPVAAGFVAMLRWGIYGAGATREAAARAASEHEQQVDSGAVPVQNWDCAPATQRLVDAVPDALRTYTHLDYYRRADGVMDLREPVSPVDDWRDQIDDDEFRVTR